MSTEVREVSKTFCILPWMHLFVLPEGKACVCCDATHPIEINGEPASLQTHDLHAIWNSSHMRRIRSRMLEGQTVSDCAACYVAEKKGGYSHRLHSNERWAKQLGDRYLDRVQEASRQDNVVADPPISYQLVPGNNCNLKCRMCFPIYSSKIERDEVHSAWAPSEVKMTVGLQNLRDNLDWTQGKVNLGPNSHAGVDVFGMYSPEVHKGLPCRWTNGDAQFSVTLPPGIRAKSIRLRVWPYHPRKHPLKVLINDQCVYDDDAPLWQVEQTFAVPPTNKQPLTVRLQSGTFRVQNDPRELGVAVQEVELIHAGTAQAQTQAAGGQNLPTGPWYRDDAWVRNVLLRNVDKIEGFYFTGGEPMIEKQVEKIIDYAIERGAAGNIGLEMNTNCTVIRDEMLAKLAQFKKVMMALSLDAFGHYHEYIRFPGKWDVIERNVKKVVALAGEQFSIAATPVVQVYNVLNMVDVFEFFDELRIPYNVRFATMPWYLSVDILPIRVKKHAAAKIQAYADRCPTEQREVVLSTADQILATKDKCSKEALQTLMQFTNDLDATRQQSVHLTHPDLLELLEAEGYSWSNERKHAAA